MTGTPEQFSFAGSAEGTGWYPAWPKPPCTRALVRGGRWLTAAATAVAAGAATAVGATAGAAAAVLG